jgi:hypothetical protein
MRKNNVLTLFMLFLTFFHMACSATPARLNSTFIIPAQDAAAAFITPDVVLLGLPDRTSQDASARDSQPVLTVGVGSNGEMVTPLSTGTRAPYNGVLLNGPAVARISVEFRSQQDRCLIEQNRAVSLVEARYVADTASLRLAADTQRRSDQVVINGLDSDVSRLNRLLELQQREASGPHVLEGLVWAGGGLVLGVLIVGGVVLATTPRP